MPSKTRQDNQEAKHKTVISVQEKRTVQKSNKQTHHF